MATDRILVTGANGQIGSALVPYLMDVYGPKQVIASDLHPQYESPGRFEILDASDPEALTRAIRRHGITQVYHLAAILSARGEADPLGTWHLNTETFFNVLEASRNNGVHKVFFPSSIAVFGPQVDRECAGQFSFLLPETAYGLSKAASENWASYYYEKYGLDVRSLRFPGIISYQSMPGGGTTDYAVDIFHKAVLQESYTCFLRHDSTLPMIYMEDALRAAVLLMDAPAGNIRVRTSYNISGMSFSPAGLTAEIRRHYPGFEVRYMPDYRQRIADSWPKRIDDTSAAEDWGWRPLFDLPRTTREMVENLRMRYKAIASAGHS